MVKSVLKRFLMTALIGLPATIVSVADDVELELFDHVTFYDGYLLTNNPDSLLDDGILRHTTSLYAVKLTDEQLNQIGDSLKMHVEVDACCDNYDRIGNINLALVPKGKESYSTDSVQRIELGRFITPFMNKNKEPTTVPYDYSIDYLSYILRDATLRAEYDIWIEFELFGVPYAANQQVAGCANRSDVFKGTLVFKTSTPALSQTTDDVLVPIVMKKPEYKGNNLNNYSETGTDTIGKTTKTYYFDVPVDVADAQLVIVTSNHGANTGGEEYNRRWHYIYVDDELMLSYRPGRKSCEPFRQYNTQANGIYGTSAKGDLIWQSFSNWCPGDVIDNRIIDLGSFSAGEHKVRISVPDAEFVDQQGDIPVSIFFQGLKEGTLTAIKGVKVMEQQVNLAIKDGIMSFGSKDGIVGVEIFDLQGKRLYRKAGSDSIRTSQFPTGLCLVSVELDNGIIETHKVAIKN
ncbi:MAG: peptide-N-glycosidase F-related protein [Prevotellaceae bacterium]|nr:peptide-N-glycosidase F-related protein [Prevotellaceae bacterium]